MVDNKINAYLEYIWKLAVKFIVGGRPKEEIELQAEGYLTLFKQMEIKTP